MSKAPRPADKGIKLAKIDPKERGSFKKEEEAADILKGNQKTLYDLHYLMYAENRRALLIILQGIDASGKDGAVRYLAGGLNPQGLTVHSFRAPSEEELDHDYLWRIHKACPGRGEVAILNRSHYEEVSTVKVHPELIGKQSLPPEIADQKYLFEQRYRQIRDFERMLTENGTAIIKLFLHISKEEQQERFDKRLSDPRKQWKFSAHDLVEREHWEAYQEAFQEMIGATSTDYAPWYVIPADRKWYRNYLIGEIVVRHLKDLPMEFPPPQE